MSAQVRLSYMFLALLLAGCFALAAGSATAAEPRREVLKLGHSRLLKLPVPAGRVSVGRAQVADVVMVTPRQLYLNALGVGTTNVSLWDQQDRLLEVFEVVVIRDLTSLKEQLYQILPNEPVEVRGLAGSVVLSGQVSSLEAKKRAEALTEAYAPKQTTSLLEVGGNQQVQLQVRFAEVSRKVTKRMNINLRILNPLTGDFLYTMLGSLITPQTDGTTLLSDKVNAMGGFHSGQTQISAFLDILKENGLAKILAEPNLVAASGQQADFLAGGEFPIPVPQRENITITYKKFGVQLGFLPEVRPGKRIRLTVAPEVSELDWSTAVVVQGFTVPGLTTRKAKTQLELADGQSFAIAGLFRDDITQSVSKFPVLGDLPILGALFRSTEFKKNKTELLIVVTPRIVRPGQERLGPNPVTTFSDPDDFAFFMLGKLATPKAASPQGPPLSPQELEGRFGHDLAW
ncbi:MAG: type II and III secretion system protein family protein [Desulfarculus sp.]|nr:type II and III secretion system protein family protein [Pseudomonadota bacterium]MBU4600245.1 type II and III secretion system protein family protein [Pseudomonadota bacterium]MBV1715892.1 type II and III secretion system protein family protein [Desulfarculus sp.]MBV1738618.1 type II and III secretion system protein family protein [Desulfarculus sp.]MBV1750744.1 type II and III secretion system protein family protein [Desulfarculus sp.]